MVGAVGVWGGWGWGWMWCRVVLGGNLGAVLGQRWAETLIYKQNGGASKTLFFRTFRVGMETKFKSLLARRRRIEAWKGWKISLKWRNAGNRGSVNGRMEPILDNSRGPSVRKTLSTFGCYSSYKRRRGWKTSTGGHCKGDSADSGDTGRKTHHSE